jgi:hypothetical protein
VADHIGIQQTLMLQGAVVLILVATLQMMARRESVIADRRVRPVLQDVVGAPAGGR